MLLTKLCTYPAAVSIVVAFVDEARGVAGDKNAGRQTQRSERVPSDSLRTYEG